jgi:alanyl-tRNA synthetase
MFEDITLDKSSLRKEFSKDYKSYYNTKLFDDLGFSRHTCRICHKNFWSLEDRDVCEDPEHTEYSFFKDKKRDISYVGMWKKFADFFKKNGHEVIPKYPVVSRWRRDLFFTIASIQDFQRIENGLMGFEYNANPLVVPQICLRFGDVENTGVTGRHFTSFMMAGQHAFNWPKEGYWRDRCIELNYKFLTDEIGVKKEDLVYNEDVWAMGDFSEFGPSLESFASGCELVNSVFTQFENSNGSVKEFKGKVVDVGWGFERLLWYYTGYDTAYEAVFKGILNKIEKKSDVAFDKKLFDKFAKHSAKIDFSEKAGGKVEDSILKELGISKKDYNEKVKPLQALYAVLDHSRTLLFAVSDGALPSNIGGGYNLRVILRRALSFIEEYNLGIGLDEVAEMHAKDLKGLYPDLEENLDILSKVIGIEGKRYAATKENGSKIIDKIIAKGSTIEVKELRTLYESNGITPELISSVAAKKGVHVEIPRDAYEGIIKGDFNRERETKKKISIDIGKFTKTEQLYYKLAEESESEVLYADKEHVVLDKTPFYPEGGGQEADHGTIDGAKVKDVQKYGNVIVHFIEGGSVKKGSKVRCIVDHERRQNLMVHHTATHLMNATLRNVLGKHAWQEGTRKEEDKAHIDVTHYDKLYESDIEKIEDFANRTLSKGIRVKVTDMERGEAEKRYGFTIYQGHGVPSKIMRIVTIESVDGKLVDAEACGGLHVAGMEQMIGMIKVIGTSRVSDGVDRVDFVAGRPALRYFQESYKQLRMISQTLNAELSSTGERVQGLLEEKLSIEKERTKMLEEIAKAVADSEEVAESVNKAVSKKEKVAEAKLNYNKQVLRKAIGNISSKYKGLTIILESHSGDVLASRGADSDVAAVDALRKKFGSRFKGGGSRDYAEGRIES